MIFFCKWFQTNQLKTYENKSLQIKGSFLDSPLKVDNKCQRKVVCWIQKDQHNETFK